MAKSGRGQSGTGLLDLPEPRRPKGSVAIRVYTVIAAIVAIPSAITAAVCAVLLFPAQSTQEAYDRSPICAAGATAAHDCALQTTAKVEYVDATKNTGKNAHGYTTTADLRPAVGHRQTVTVSKSRDLTFEISEGDIWPALVWRDEVTRYTFDGTTHNTDKNPHEIVVKFLIATAAFLCVGSFFGRVFIRRVMWKRIATNPRRHRVPEWTLLALGAMTIMAASVRASYATAIFALMGVSALIGSVAVWPFLPSVRRPDPGSVLGRGRTRAPIQRRDPRRR